MRSPDNAFPETSQIDILHHMHVCILRLIHAVTSILTTAATTQHFSHRAYALLRDRKSNKR